MRPEHAVVHSLANNQQPRPPEQVDSRIASESASDAGDQNNEQNSTANCSLILVAVHVLASRVELRPKQNPDPLTEMTIIMLDQTTCI